MAAAALAASVISSQAAVYSQNIVGYVNVPFPTSGYVNLANPLDNPNSNQWTNTIPNPSPGGPGNGVLDGAALYVWNGNGYSTYFFDSTAPGGFDNGGGSPLSYTPTNNPGGFMFVLNNTGNPYTNTYVGTVHVDGLATGTNVVGFTTNVLGLGYNFVASKISIGGGISSVLQMSNPSPGGPGNGVLDGAGIYQPNINGSGTFSGYTLTYFDSTSSTGFDYGNGNPGAPEPQVPVGQGVIILNNTGVVYDWVQSL